MRFPGYSFWNRDILLSLDIAGAREVLRRQRPDLAARTEWFDDDEMILATLHKARTAALDLPLETRLASRRWLKRHGMRSLDFGTLPPEREARQP